MQTTLFIGNPGAGKSTTLNCYLGTKAEECFQSGISKDGAGVTYKLDVKEHNGQRWMDTPGLSCKKYREAAAAAINEALQQGGEFRIAFVLTHESGRVRPDDITTISLVIEACNAQVPQIGVDQYAIIFNKTSSTWLEEMDQASREVWKRENFWTPFEEKGIPTTKLIHFAVFQTELFDKTNVQVPLCPQTRAFIDGLPVLQIDPTKVGQVNSADFDAMCEKMNALTEELVEAQEDAALSRKQAEADRLARARAEVCAAQAEEDARHKAHALDQERKRAQQEKENMAAAHKAEQERSKLENDKNIARAKADADAKVNRAHAEQARLVEESKKEVLQAKTQAAADADAKVKRAQEEQARLVEENKKAVLQAKAQAAADADAKVKRAQAEQARLVEENKKEVLRAKAQATAEAEARERRKEEESRRVAAKNSRITAKLEGRGVGGNQLWTQEANCIGMINDTKVAVNFSTSLGKSVNVAPNSRVHRDWAFNAVLFWEVPDVTVHWVAATSPQQNGSMLVQAGQVLRLSQ